MGGCISTLFFRSLTAKQQDFRIWCNSRTSILAMDDTKSSSHHIECVMTKYSPDEENLWTVWSPPRTASHSNGSSHVATGIATILDNSPCAEVHCLVERAGHRMHLCGCVREGSRSTWSL